MVELNSIIIHTLYWSSTKYSAKMSVWLKHCITAFIKHVLPWFCKPTTPGTRSGGHACRFSGGTRPFVVVVLAVVCLAYGKYWIIKKEREKMKWFFFFFFEKKVQVTNTFYRNHFSYVHYFLGVVFQTLFCDFSPLCSCHPIEICSKLESIGRTSKWFQDFYHLQLLSTYALLLAVIPPKKHQQRKTSEVTTKKKARAPTETNEKEFNGVRLRCIAICRENVAKKW